MFGEEFGEEGGEGDSVKGGVGGCSILCAVGGSDDFDGCSNFCRWVSYGDRSLCLASSTAGPVDRLLRKNLLTVGEIPILSLKTSFTSSSKSGIFGDVVNGPPFVVSGA